jgi:hypothetical protein
MGVVFLSIDGARAWCRQNGIPLGTRSPELPAGTLTPLRFSIPQDAGARVALAKGLYPNVWDRNSEVLIWTTDWSVWASGEHLPLYTRLRQALGDRRPIEEAPAQVVDAGARKMESR